MSYGLLVVRVVLGLLLAGHGAQKLFGWFGGAGLPGTAAMFTTLRYRAPVAVALLGGLVEFAGGLLFAAGLVTPLAALGFAAVMLNAVAAVHWRNGLWVTNGGYEYNLLIYAVAVTVAITGPGRFSVDGLLGWANAISGPWWGAAVVVVSVLLAALSLTLGRRRPATGSEQQAGEERSTRAS